MTTYDEIKKECIELLKDERNFIANSSNFASLIYHRLKSLNWVGFYFVKCNQLILGPFQGKPACIKIEFGKGVCGKCAETANTIVVPNVHEFPGHIACDSASNSEIVIPLKQNGRLYGVFDIDSPAFNRFSDEDKTQLEELVKILIQSSKIEKIDNYYNPFE